MVLLGKLGHNTGLKLNVICWVTKHEVQIFDVGREHN